MADDFGDGDNFGEIDERGGRKSQHMSLSRNTSSQSPMRMVYKPEYSHITNHLLRLDQRGLQVPSPGS